MKVFLAPNGRCSFSGRGNVKIEFEKPDSPFVKPPVWNYVLNYTGEPCSLYGGNTLEEAMRNATSGFWMKGGRNEKNCGFYVVVGNNYKDKNAEFTFYRTNAILTMGI